MTPDRWVDIQRLAQSMPEFRGALAAGWDREDLLQECQLMVWSRQTQKSRYDPDRSGVGHYLVVVLRGILLNALEKRKTHRATFLSIGLVGEDGEEVDASTLAVGESIITDDVGDLVNELADELGEEDPIGLVEGEVRQLLSGERKPGDCRPELVAQVRTMLRKRR